MIERLFFMDGYGVFVWSAFGFTIFNFAFLYLITKFQLIKEQKKFANKFGNLSVDKIEIAKKQKINKEILINNSHNYYC